MIVLEIDITDIEDLKMSKNDVVMSSILTTAKEVLVASGRVILKRSYCNAPDDIIKIYSSVETFQQDEQGLFSIPAN